MTENARDTQFLGFAKLLQDELAEHTKNTFMEQVDTVRFMREQRTIIAQRAYDFASSIAIDAFDLADAECTDTYRLIEEEEVLHNMKDLTHWPPTPTEPPASQ